MVLGSTQPLTEINTWNISWGVKAAGKLGTQPCHFHVPIVMKTGSLNIMEPSGPVIGLHRDCCPFTCSNRLEANWNCGSVVLPAVTIQGQTYEFC